MDDKLSFAAEVKEEILLNKIDGDALKAQLSAIIKVTGSFIMRSNRLILKSTTENNKLVRHTFSTIKSLYNVSPNTTVSQTMKLYKRYTYGLEISEKVNEILDDLEIGQNITLSGFPTKKLLKNDECIRYYLSGVFLASGSVNSPKKTNYHLEMSVLDEEYARYIIKLAKRINKSLEFKLIKRRSQYVIYLKKSDSIVDFLLVIGATTSMFTFEDQRSKRDISNSLNRLNNCLIANEVKSIESAQEQVKAINLINQRIGINTLNERLRSVAYLRLEFEEASLAELARIYEERTGKSISKGGINHRLKDLEKIAENLSTEVNND